MMKIYLGIYIFIWAILCQCQKTTLTPESGDLAAFLLLGGEQMDEAVEMKMGTDSCLRILGVSSSFGRGDQDIYVAKLLPKGLLVWQRFIGGKSNDQAGGMALQEDNVLLTGTWTRPDSSGFQITLASDMFFGKLDKEGNIYPEKTYRFVSSSKDLGQALSWVNGNQILIGGSINGVAGMLILCQSSGDTIWTRHLPQPQLRVNGLLDVGSNDFGNLVGLGYQGMDSLVVFTYSMQGQLLNTLYINVPNVRGSSAKMCIEKDGSMVIAFSRQISPQFADIVVRKYSASFQLVWTRSFTNGGLSSFQHIRKSQQNGYLISGSHIANGSSLSQAFFARIGEDGDLIWEKYISGSIYSRGVDAIEDLQGQIILLLNNARVNQSNTDILVGWCDQQGNWITHD